MTAGRYFDMQNPLGREPAPGAATIGELQLGLMQMARRSANEGVTVPQRDKGRLAAARRLVAQGLLDYERHGNGVMGYLHVFVLTATGRSSVVEVKHVPHRGHGSTQRRRRR